MKTVTSSRRQLVMAVLLALAVLGAAMRYWAPNPSTLRDVGTLLLVLWLPAVGNLVGFAIRRFGRSQPKAPFSETQHAFAPHLFVQLTPMRQDSASLAAATQRCTLVVGSEGFTAATEGTLDRILARFDPAPEVPLELTKPELALPRLMPGTRFLLLVGSVAVAQGNVVRASAPG